MIAYLRGQGQSTGLIGVFWVLLGLAALAGVPLWGWLLDRLRSGHSLALMNGVLAAGAVLPLLVANSVTGLVSAVLFGNAFLAVPAGMAHLARHRLPPAVWTAAIGWLTVTFAVGQCIGPGLAGVLADRSGGAGIGLAIAAIALAATAIVYLISESDGRRHRARSRSTPRRTGPGPGRREPAGP